MRHVNSFGVKTLCGLVRLKEESTIEDYFHAPKDERCATCENILRKRGYNVEALEFRFSKNNGNTH